MTREDRFGRSGGTTPPGISVEEYSFDELAKGLAGGTIPRGRALKLLGASLLGAALLPLFPGVASADKFGRRCRNNGGTVCRKDRGDRRGVCCRPGEVCVNGRCELLGPSDRNLKERFGEVDERQVLERLAGVRVETWSYKDDHPSVRHIGPMAQDFAAAFGVGGDDRHINMVDASGVAMAAIQALYRMSQEKDARIDALQAEVARLAQRDD